MEGGINAWRGLVAEGVPEAGMAYFSPATKPEELIGLAWLLEDGSRRFYSELTVLLEDMESKDLLKELSIAEEHHQASLFKLYKEFSGVASDPGFPGSVIPSKVGGDFMEGGMRLDEALEWAKKRKLTEILELSISLEANSFDLYVKMKRQMKDPRSAQVFDLLSSEEKHHLEQLSSLLEKNV
jgi:sulfur-carrier protein adenylyltransferase/sulfurtransferase